MAAVEVIVVIYIAWHILSFKAISLYFHLGECLFYRLDDDLHIGLNRILRTELLLLPDDSHLYIAQLVVAIHGPISTNTDRLT